MGFFPSLLLIFKGTPRPDYLFNLKVRGIIFPDALIRPLTSLEGCQLTQEHSQNVNAGVERSVPEIPRSPGPAVT